MGSRTCRRAVIGAALLALLPACTASDDGAGPATTATASSPAAEATTVPSRPGAVRPAEAPRTDCPTTAPWRPRLGESTTTSGPGSPSPPTPPLGPDGQPDDRAPLVALDPATGAVRWRVCPGPWAWSDAVVLDGLVLVRGRAFAFAFDATLPCGSVVDPVLFVLSSADGGVVWAADDRQAWSYNDDPPAPDPTADVVLVQDRDDAGASTVRAFDLRSGDERWSAPGTVRHDDDPAAIDAEQGSTSWVDRRTGAPAAPPATEPPFTPRLPRTPGQPSLARADGTRVGIDGTTITFTEPDGGTRWSVPAPSFVTEVRAVHPDLVVVAGGTRVGNCP